ncbi:TPR-repeat protein, partial [mine drainage metagenome]
MDQEPEAIYESAVEAEKRGELDRAEGLYIRFKSVSPTDPRGPNKLGVICALRRDMEGADRYFREALHLDSKHVPALTNMGNLLLESGQTDDAISYYEEALHWDPDYVPAHRNIAA